MRQSSVTRCCVLVVGVLALGCASNPSRPASDAAKRGRGAVFQHSLETVRTTALEALVVFGFELEEETTHYLEGHRPHKMGLFVGSGGETVGLWLEPLDDHGTRVLVDTSKSLLGIVGQRNWNDEILAEIGRSLSGEVESHVEE